MSLSSDISFGLTQKGKRKLIDAEGHTYTRNSKGNNVEYWKCTNSKCRGRFTYYPSSGTGKLSLSHDEEDELEPNTREREAAIEKLKEATLSAEGSVKAVQLVSQVLIELPPEVRAVMPSEDLLIQRVQRWAKANNIQLEKATADDYLQLRREEPGNSRNESINEDGDQNLATRQVSRTKRRRHKRNTLNLVDDEGNVIGGATLDDIGYGIITNWQEKKAGELQANESTQHTASVPQSYTRKSDQDPEDDYMDHGGDDFQMNCDIGEPEDLHEPEQQSIASVFSASRGQSTKSVLNIQSKDSVKSGELCVVCGDELIVSEKLAASQDVFRKACCYLNVKSEGDWFSKSKSSGFYSFCESCTNEIIKIHSLYKKVEEIQSLIFKKVESVEKRIADAEIVDNWMAEAPHSSAVRFEGFRKQVMINYRNKLKLRREIRFGRKTGQTLLKEVQPSTSANMFATDPCDLSSDSVGNKPVKTRSSKGKTLGRPKSKKSADDRENTEVDGEPELSDYCGDFLPDFDDCQDDAMSVASDREVKFWKDDPDKLNIPRPKSKKRVEAASDDQFKEGNTSKMGISEKRQEKVVKNRYFPAAVLTKDGRVFLEGIEIIKNPPGVYKPRPFSTSFTCGACGKVVRTFWSIRAHICGHHLGLYNCATCSKEFMDPQTLQNHVTNFHGKHTYQDCPECGKPVRIYTNSMEFHRWRHLSADEKKDPRFVKWCPPRYKDSSTRRKKSFMCGQCGKSFHYSPALRKHELIHEPGYEVNLMCQYCGRTYTNRDNLRKHVGDCARRAQGIAKAKSYPCPKCTTRFTTPNARSVHMRRRHRKYLNLPFSCPKCSRMFSSAIGLNNHKRVCIDGEKGYNTKKSSCVEQQQSSLTSANVFYTKYDSTGMSFGQAPSIWSRDHDQQYS